MLCPKCGAEIHDDAVFCPMCGAPVETPAPKRRHTGAIVAIIVVVVIACIVGGFLYHRHTEEVKAQEAAQATYDTAHSEHMVVFTVSAPGYDDTACSKIPLHVSGTDLDGNAVDVDAWIGSDGHGLELEQGTYTITFVASPLLADGTLYATPADELNLVPGSELESGDDYTIPSDQAIDFTIADPLSITDGQIQAAHDAALESGMDQATADNLKKAVTDNRQAAIDKKAADDAATAQEAAHKASCHYENEYFSLDVPESWENGVTCEEMDGANGGQANFYSFYKDADSQRAAFVIAVGTGSGIGDAGESHNQVTLGTTSSDPSWHVDYVYPNYNASNQSSVYTGESWQASADDLQSIKDSIVVK